MFRKICNYLTVLSFSLIVSGSVLAAPMVLTDKNEEVRVDENKDFSFYNDFLSSGGKHSYEVKVEAGKDVRIKFKGSRAVMLKIQTPDGETKTYSQDKYYDIKLHGEGKYVVEIDSLFISQYSLEIFNK